MECKAISEIKKEVPNLIIVLICFFKVCSLQLTFRVTRDSDYIPRYVKG